MILKQLSLALSIIVLSCKIAQGHTESNIPKYQREQTATIDDVPVIIPDIPSKVTPEPFKPSESQTGGKARGWASFRRDYWFIMWPFYFILLVVGIAFAAAIGLLTPLLRVAETVTRIIYEILVSVAKVIAPITRGAVLAAIQVARLVKLILTLAYELMLAPTYENIFLPLYNNVIVPFIERLVVPCWHLCWRAVHFVVAEFIAPSLNYAYFTITCRTRLARPLVIIGILLCFTGALMLAVQSLGRLLNWDATGLDAIVSWILDVEAVQRRYGLGAGSSSTLLDDFFRLLLFMGAETLLAQFLLSLGVRLIGKFMNLGSSPHAGDEISRGLFAVYPRTMAMVQRARISVAFATIAIGTHGIGIPLRGACLAAAVIFAASAWDEIHHRPDLTTPGQMNVSMLSVVGRPVCGAQIMVYGVLFLISSYHVTPFSIFFLGAGLLTIAAGSNVTGNQTLWLAVWPIWEHCDLGLGRLAYRLLLASKPHLLAFAQWAVRAATYISIALSFALGSAVEYMRGNVACAQFYLLLALQTLLIPFWRVVLVIREIYSNPIGALVCSCAFVYFLYQVYVGFIVLPWYLIPSDVFWFSWHIVVTCTLQPALGWVWWLTGAQVIALMRAVVVVCARWLTAVLTWLGFGGQWYTLHSITSGSVFSSPKFAKQVYFVWLAVSYLWNLSLPEFVKDKVRPPNPREGSPREGNPREESPREGNPREEEEAGIGPAIRRLMSYESVLNPDEGADTDSDDAGNTESGSAAGQGTASVATDTTDVIQPQQTAVQPPTPLQVRRGIFKWHKRTIQMKEEAVIINARTGEFVEEYNMDKASRVTLARKKFVTIRFRNHTPSIARLWFRTAHQAALWHDKLSSCLDDET